MYNFADDSRFSKVDPNKCYRNLELPFIVNHSLQHRKSAIHNFEEVLIALNEIDPVFTAFLSKLKLHVALARYFTNSPDHVSMLHVDKFEPGDQTVALNFAYRDSGTIFRWFKLKQADQFKYIKNSNGVPVLKFSEAGCTTVLEEGINHKPGQPFLINTGYIHSFSVAGTNRFCYSYFLVEHGTRNFLQWGRAMEIFGKYIH